MSDDNNEKRPINYPEPPQQVTPPPDQSQISEPDPNRAISEQDARAFKTAQNLVLVASLAGPVSIFFGGMLLSGAGFVCAIFAFRKFKYLTRGQSSMQPIVKGTRRACIVAMIICSIAFVLNMIYAIVMFPVVLNALETGEYETMFSGIDQGLNNIQPEDSSIWN